MNVEEAIVFAAEPLVPEIAPGVYEGKATTYCTYNYSMVGRSYAAGRPVALVCLGQLHLYMPVGKDSFRLKINLSMALFNAGCTYPSIEDLSDKSGQHFVFEFEYKENL